MSQVMCQCGGYAHPKYQPLCYNCYYDKVGSVQFIKEHIIDNLQSYPRGTWVTQGNAIGGMHDGLRHLILLEDEGVIERKTRTTKSSVRFWFRLK